VTGVLFPRKTVARKWAGVRSNVDMADANLARPKRAAALQRRAGERLSLQVTQYDSHIPSKLFKVAQFSKFIEGLRMK
jgi:hypothetical protein